MINGHKNLVYRETKYFYLFANRNKIMILIVAIAINNQDPKGCQKNSYKVCPFLYKTIGKNSKMLL
jgi:hypothetical protein